jgi:hypothetical protein
MAEQSSEAKTKAIKLPDQTVSTKEARINTDVPKVIEVLKRISASEPSPS